MALPAYNVRILKGNEMNVTTFVLVLFSTVLVNIGVATLIWRYYSAEAISQTIAKSHFPVFFFQGHSRGFHLKTNIKKPHLLPEMLREVSDMIEADFRNDKKVRTPGKTRKPRRPPTT